MHEVRLNALARNACASEGDKELVTKQRYVSSWDENDYFHF